MKVHLFSDDGHHGEDIITVISRFELLNHKLESSGRERILVDMHATTLPTFDEQGVKYDVLLFDWGGMSFGNSMLEHFSNRFIRCAEDRPSSYFVIISSMTKDAIDEAEEELQLYLPNVYYSLDEFCGAIERGEVDV